MMFPNTTPLLETDNNDSPESKLRHHIMDSHSPTAVLFLRGFGPLIGFITQWIGKQGQIHFNRTHFPLIAYDTDNESTFANKYKFINEYFKLTKLFLLGSAACLLAKRRK